MRAAQAILQNVSAPNRPQNIIENETLKIKSRQDAGPGAFPGSCE
jgi:hypothetical protein